MSKFLVETHYTCVFKIVHELEELNEKSLSDIDNRQDGRVEIVDVTVNNRKTKKAGAVKEIKKNELEEKVGVINEGLLDEIATISVSDPLAPLEKKFVTLDQLTEHYRLFLSRIQEQIGTIGGGGAVELTDLDDVDDSNRSHKSIIMYNDVTGKYEAADPDMNAGISNEDHSGDEIILNAYGNKSSSQIGAYKVKRQSEKKKGPSKNEIMKENFGF